MRLGKTDISYAARIILNFIRDNKIQAAEDIARLVGEEYKDGQGRLKILASPPYSTPVSYFMAFTFNDYLTAQAVRAGVSQDKTMVKMLVCMGEELNNGMGYTSFPGTIGGNKAQRKEIPAVRNPIDMIKDELKGLVALVEKES